MKTFNRVGLGITALATVALLGACNSPTPGPSSPVGPASTPVVTVTVAPTSSPAPVVTPPPPPPPPPLGWPRDGWTQHTGVEVNLKSIALYYPNSWTFDTNESGLWWDGTYHVFCDPYVDHTLNNPGAPDAETLATWRWDLIGYPPAANQQGFTTFYGYDGWRGDVTLEGGAVEHRAYVIVGDVWIHCGSITRDTAASGDELWDIVDSVMIVDESSMQQHAWNVD